MAISSEWTPFMMACSDIFGWVYFLLWSASFYPQPLLNIRRRSTSGLTVDFPLLNVLGFVCYTIYTASLVFSSEIRRQYAERHPNAPEPTVKPNDFAFAVHALGICMITYSQLWSKPWGFEVLPGKRASRVTQGIFCGCIAGMLIVALIVLCTRGPAQEPFSWREIDIIYAASWTKVIVTCAKYVPQAWQNYRVKSTSGWSIGQILLDISGGVLSIAQLVVDSVIQDDWSGITGNPVKLFLGNVSIFFDVIFITQHYMLYGSNETHGGGHMAAKVPERRPLLESDEDARSAGDNV